MAVPAANLYLILAVYLAALIRGVESLVSHSEPSLQWDGNTTKDCTAWYDNIDGYTCRQIRDDFLRIPPEDFTRWNPSITLDCDNWKFLSYCIEVASEMTTTTSTPRHTTTSSTSTTSTVRPTPIAWEPLGCYVDGNPHTVRNRSEKASGQDLTIAKCQDDCWASGYRYVGVTGGTECYCGRFVVNEYTPDQSDCNIPCAGDDSETCGGSSAMYAYGAKTYELPPWTITIPHPSATTSSVSTTPTSAATSVPTGSVFWRDMGCFKDLYPANSRTLEDLAFTSDTNLTIEACQTACSGPYLWAGVENGRECWCSLYIQSPATNTEVSLTDCDLFCSGDDSELCGGSARIHLYNKAATPAYKWVDLGCYVDEYPHVLRNKVEIGEPNSHLTCKAACGNAGYTYAGVENGTECWCDDVINEPGKLASQEECDDNPTISSHSGSPETSATSETSTTSKGEAGEDEESTATSHFGGTRAAALLIMIALL